MIRRQTLVLIVLFTLCKLTCAQIFPIDSINKIDSKGRKDGLWVEYIDTLFRSTNKKNATYYWYNRFYNGKGGEDIFKNYPRRKWKAVYAKTKGDTLRPVDGIFQFRKDSATWTEFSFEKGMPIYIKCFGKGYDLELPTFKMSRTELEAYEIIDYKKLYKNTPGTYYYQFGTKTKGYFRNGENGWSFYPVDQ
jgi:hypothetical protein